MTSRIPASVLFSLGLLLYLGVSVIPAWQGLHSGRYAADWASYHYAVQAAAAGEDPYQQPVLERFAREDGFEGEVYPYLYPPPFLLGVWWMAGLSPSASRDGLFVLNQLCWLGLGGVLWRWFRAPLWLLVGIGLTLTPITHAGRLGQVNGAVALLTSLALWKQSGLVLSGAAMIKMSPALYLPVWAARGQWRPVGMAVLGAVGLSLASLLVAPLFVQMGFYRDLLPGFAAGSYNDLQVPIALAANHSIPNLLDALWPGPDAHTLSPPVRWFTSALLVAVLLGAMVGGRRERDALGEACLLGALTAGLVVLPVFAYEHHLSLLVLPAAALGTALARGRLPKWCWIVAILAYVGVAWPLAAFRQAQQILPDDAALFVRETKLLGVLLLGALCAWAAYRSSAGERDQISTLPAR